MKILFLNTNIGYGGASKILVWLANLCASKGYEVSILTYRDNCIRQDICSNIKFIYEPLEEDAHSLTSLFRTVRFLHTYIRKNKFDICVAFLFPSQLRLSLASIGTSSKLLFSHRGDPYSKKTGLVNRFIDAINLILFSRADAFVFQTEKAKKFFNNKVQKRSVVIPNPVVPLQRTIDRKGNIEKVIVSVGRLDVKQKRQDLLISAFNLISNSYPDYKLVFYGDGPDEVELKRMAEGNNRILFKGRTNNVVEAIQNASIFVLSSDFEGIPNALIEAMSIGVPCISTDCSPGGAALLIDNKVNGLLTRRGDIDDLASAISFYLDNSELAESNALNAMKISYKYSEKIIGSSWINFIENICR